MRTHLTLALAALVAAVAAGAARSAPLAPTRLVLSPCPAPPVAYKPVPFNGLSWNWEIGQWSAACGIGWLEGPRRVAALMHVSSTDKRTIASAYAAYELKMLILKAPASRTIAERIGVTRVHNLLAAGILTGFRLRGRP